MYIDLADKLLSHIFEFWRLHRDSKKDAFDASVALLFDEFEKIHAQYLVKFREYRESLLEKDCNLTDLIEKIHQERFFTQANRTKLIELSIALDRNDDLGYFCGLLLNYLTVSHSEENAIERGYRLDQRWSWTMSQLIQAINAPDLSTLDIDWTVIRSTPLLHLLDERRFGIYLSNVKLDKNAIAIRIIDLIVESMQKEYKRICQEYARLRVKYLQ